MRDGGNNQDVKELEAVTEEALYLLHHFLSFLAGTSGLLHMS